MAERKFYGLRNDYMFKAVLQESKEALKNLISVLLGIDEDTITSLELKNTIKLGESVDSKDCILDILLELNHNELIDLEMQVKNENNWPERSLLYWSRAYDDIKVGEDYDKLKKTYHIGILDFTLFDDNPTFYAEYKVMDTTTHRIYSDMLNIKILDLSRIEEAERNNENPQLIKWAKILKTENLSQMESLTADEEVLNKMVVTIKELSDDERIRYQCQAREDYERRLRGQYKQGLNEGIEQGIAQGIAQGIEQGIEQERSSIINTLSKTFAPEDIAKMLNINLNEVLDLLNSK